VKGLIEMLIRSDEDDAALEEETSPGAGRQLGLDRTEIASERTLMAWVRTAVSLIGFGFSIPKFFSYLEAAGPVDVAGGLSPKFLGVVLIGLGTLGLAGGIAEHFRLMKKIAPSEPVRASLCGALFAAIVVALIGLLAFISVIAS
jgi:putative membrane protein